MQPGCHGSAVAVSAASASCRACPYASSCVREAAGFLETLPEGPVKTRERLALIVTGQALTRQPSGGVRGEGAPVVVASTRGLKRLVLTERQLAAIAALPARVASQVKTLMERGWFEFARKELNEGRNPAEKGWRHVYCQQLLTGAATRDTLQMAFAEQLSLAPASAKVQTSIALAVFAAGEVAVERSGVLTLLPPALQG